MDFPSFKEIVQIQNYLQKRYDKLCKILSLTSNVLQNETFLTKCAGTKTLSRITCKKTLSFFDAIQY